MIGDDFLPEIEDNKSIIIQTNKIYDQAVSPEKK